MAAQLAAADEPERAALLEQHAGAGVELAHALRAAYLEASNGQPARAIAAVAALSVLAQRTGDAEVRALAAWVEGLAALQLRGEMEPALLLLDRAAAGFTALGQPATAAATQVGKVFALAMLGRYADAAACGLAARDVFVSQGDTAAAGRMEQNLGNLSARQDRYAEAEQFFQAARARFVALDDRRQLAQAHNSLATALSSQHRFREAAALYQQALADAEATGLEVTQAEIECNLGCLALFQGQYDGALEYLERSRRHYTVLGLPHRAARPEGDLADAYLDLNLITEADQAYRKVIPLFAQHGMRAEQA